MCRMDYLRRVGMLREEMLRRRIDAFLVTNAANVSYLSGFRGHDSAILVTRRKKFFLTDSRYVEEAAKDVKGYDIELVGQSTYATLQELVSRNHLRRIGFESMNLPYEVARRLKGLIGSAKVAPLRDIVEKIRGIKERHEVELIRRSAMLTKRVLEKALRMVRPGASEESLARKIESEFIENRARASFNPIVAAGRNSSKPHATAGRSRIRKDSFVMIDMGCALNGYNSDLTRMALTGRISNKFRSIYGVVARAQELVIGMIKPGVKISDVDETARHHIRINGFGKYFGHSLGHGIGLEVHENPAISKASTGLLRAGMVFTVEPAIYIPGFGGVRIEDMVLVTEAGCEVLTK